MRPLWTVAEAVAATGGRPEGLSDGPLGSISIDSRDIASDALFVAIKGENFDGHDFVGAALANGAAAALVSEAYHARNSGERLIVVNDPLEGLVSLARAARARSKAQIVAVTGSAGKTTAKEAIRQALVASGETHYSIKSFNNHWGVPLMLARLPHEARFGVFEIGMNHAGEVTPLAKLVRPHIAVITTVAAAHLEFFKSVSDIAAAKAEIFSGLEPGGTALLNADHDYLHILFTHARLAKVGHIVTYGFDESADWQIERLERSAGGALAEVRHGEERFALQLAAAGRHMAANAVAALAICALVGGDTRRAVDALGTFTAPEGRGETLRLGPPGNPLLLVDESYNANLASMRAAMEVFAGIAAPSGRKVLVLGDMRELGMQGPELHRSLRKDVLDTGATDIFLIGAAMGTLAEALGPDAVRAHAQTVEEIIEPVLSSLAYGDAVMVKGSNGVRLGSLVKSIRERF